MKYQRLVSSTTPSSLQEWLGKELDERGIDSVYARSVLSLLQQDCIDIEPHECHHGRRLRLKELHKHSGPGKPGYVTKSKHQKWRSRDMQTVLLTSYPCCKTVLPDLEKLKKRAAIDCLQSATDYIDGNDIEELIDEAWEKLKSEKTLKGEKEEKALRKFKDPFYIPPSSPTDEIEKYFAAFPPLNDKVGAEAAINKYEITENVWYNRCIAKKKLETKDEVSHDSESLYLRSPTRGGQPIIPYNSLKSIRNVYKNDVTVPSITIKKEANEFILQLKNNALNKNEKIMKASFLQSLGNYFMQYPTITINNCCLETNAILNAFQSVSIKNIHDAFMDTNCKKCALKIISKLNTYSHVSKLEDLLSEVEKSTLEKAVHPDISALVAIQNNGLASYVSTSEIYAPVCENTLAENPISNSLENHFEMWGHSASINYLDITRSVLSSLSLNDYSDSLVIGSCADNVLNSLNCIHSSETESIFSELGITPTFSEYLLPCKGKNSSFDYSLWEPKKNAVQILPERVNIPEVEENVLELNIIEESNGADKFPFNLLPEPKKISEEFSNEDLLKDEVYFSDDESLLIVSYEKENFTSSNTHFQPIHSSNSMSDLTSCVFESDIQINKKYALESDVQRNCNSPGVRSLSHISLEALMNKSDSLSSSCEELSLLLEHQLRKPFSEEDSVLKQNDSHRISSYLCISPVSENFPLKKAQCIWETNFKPFDENWALQWIGNYSFIEYIWERENEFFEIDEENCDFRMSASIDFEMENDWKDLQRSMMNLEDFVVEITPNPTVSPKSESPHLGTPVKEPEADTESSSEQDSFLETSSQLHEFGIDNYETNLPEIECSHQPYNLCSSFYNTHELSNSNTISDDGENLYSFTRHYSEGGGWSLAPESFSEYEFENSTEPANSLGDLDSNNSGARFLELFHQKCASDTDSSLNLTGSELVMSMFKKCTKQKYKRPCSFFLQGTCCRSDCKFSHDFSNTTCRFWKEGSCFKGDTCPFLHGYISGIEKVSNGEYCMEPEIIDKKYSLESELDFPSLSSAQEKEPREKSAAIDIKLSRAKKNKEKKM